jgi:hypothetical protein
MVSMFASLALFAQLLLYEANITYKSGKNTILFDLKQCTHATLNILSK